MLQALEAEFLQTALRSLDEVDAAFKVGALSPDNREDWKRLHEVLHNLKGQGATFGFPLVSELAEYACEFMRKQETGSSDDLALIDAVGRGLRLILTHGMRGDTDERGRALIQRFARSLA